MRQFNYSDLANQTWDHEFLAYIAKIHEYKGKQELLLHQKPVILDRLLKITEIQSTEASNRIEGITTTSVRFKQLIKNQTTPKNTDEEEILGYRNVFNSIRSNHELFPLCDKSILQMHRDLLKYTGLPYSGHYKTAPNEIDKILLSSERIVLFKPLEPDETPYAITMICKKYQEALDNAESIKDEKEREYAIFLAEDRFNYWMDIYPRSASLKNDFEELYNNHRVSLERNK